MVSAEYEHAVDKVRDSVLREGHHYTKKIRGNCKLCIRCKDKKTKYQCEGCSAALGMDIRVCILCMKEYHENPENYIR